MAANITLRMNGNAAAAKVTNAEWAKIVEYYQMVYATRDQIAPLTEAEIVTAVHTDFVNAMTAAATRHAREAVAKAAADALPAITPAADAVV